ncbi:MAG: trypsin-like peptidase domain-containing protein [Roseomonas sp.]|nr:trypsin-like peptidase domain-containing protein [Roseomonas sp.]
MEDAANTFEREKWLAEQNFKNKELAIKERAQSTSEQDFLLKITESRRSRWGSPLFVAILVAAIAAAGNAVVAFMNGRQSEALENTRAEASRILEMIKTGDADKAAANLRFLADSGLIENSERLDAIRRFLAERAPGQGPSLPSPSATAGLQPTRTLPASDPLRPSTSAVGRLVIPMAFGASATRNVTCTAFRVAADLILTASYCLGRDQPAERRIEFFPVATDGSMRAGIPIKLPPREIVILPGTLGASSENLGIAVLQIDSANVIDGGWLTLSSDPPVLEQPLGAVAFLNSPEQMLARDTRCRVFSVNQSQFAHGCQLGQGAGGAPILNSEGTRVVGIESWGGVDLGWAIRADQVVSRSEILRRVATPVRR